jgi:hypothetical protein
VVGGFSRACLRDAAPWLREPDPSVRAGARVTLAMAPERPRDAKR